MMKHIRTLAEALIVAAAVCGATTSASACSPPVIGGRPVTVAGTPALVKFASAVARVELLYETSSEWKARTIEWLKGSGPESMLLSNVGHVCPPRPLRPGDKLIIFATARQAENFELLPLGGDPQSWIAGNYYLDAEGIADHVRAEIAR